MSLPSPTQTTTTTNTTTTTHITSLFTQDTFLKGNVGKKVILYFQDGFKMVGIILGFDQFTITVTSRQRTQLIFKSAIANIIHLE
jgi:RNA chaperone Hfq